MGVTILFRKVFESCVHQNVNAVKPSMIKGFDSHPIQSNIQRKESKLLVNAMVKMSRFRARNNFFRATQKSSLVGLKSIMYYVI